MSTGESVSDKIQQLRQTPSLDQEFDRLSSVVPQCRFARAVRLQPEYKALTHHDMPTDSDKPVKQQLEGWLKTFDAEVVSVADSLCDRHAKDPDTIALLYEDALGNSASYTFGQLRDLSSKSAGALKALGVTKGDRVATLLPKSPELVVTTLGLWRLGAAHVPLFTAFGPKAIASRIENSEACVLVTDTTNRHKISLEESDSRSPQVITVTDETGGAYDGDVAYLDALAQADPVVDPVLTSGDDLFILIYTSGTTGSPKGVEIPVKALASFIAYMRFGLDVRDDDVYWNMADPGWAYGLFYALVGPLLLGKATIFFNAPFDVNATYRILETYGVTNVTTAPTVFRMMRAAGDQVIPSDTSSLRLASCAGEPLNPDVVRWGREQLGVPIHDHYGQTEGGMMVCNHQFPELQQPIRPGSMGHATPGFRIVILNSDGEELQAGEEGQLAVDTQASPSFWYRGYFNDPERTAERFTGNGRYYLTGDSASRDADGYISFSGRADDIITSAGYRIGPFEPESALLAHEAVAEVAVVGIADELRGEIVKAFVVLKPGYDPSPNLAENLRTFVQSTLSAHAYPRQIEFINELPKTPSGKVQRFLLRGTTQ